MIPKDPLVYPKDPVLSNNPMTVWDGIETINPTNFREGSGFLGDGIFT